MGLEEQPAALDAAAIPAETDNLAGVADVWEGPEKAWERRPWPEEVASRRNRIIHMKEHDIGP